MRFVLILFSLILSSSAFAEGARRSTSFLQMMLDGRMEELDSELGQDCVQQIRKAVRDGGDLGSPILRAAITPLGSIKKPSGVQDDTFYHYTNSSGLFQLFEVDQLLGEAHKKAVARKSYDKIFEHLRTRTLKGGSYAFWSRVFYVAEDPKSSSNFGSFALEFKLNPNAQAFVYSEEKVEQALTEVTSRNNLIACPNRLTFPFSAGTANMRRAGRMSNLFFIIAEESGIEMVDYLNGAWYMILSPSVFQDVRRYRPPGKDQ